MLGLFVRSLNESINRDLALWGDVARVLGEESINGKAVQSATSPTFNFHNEHTINSQRLTEVSKPLSTKKSSLPSKDQENRKFFITLG